MNIVVTGGYGFIGSSFVNLLGKLYPSVNIIIIDKLTYAANKNNVIVPHKSIIKDICDINIDDVKTFDYIVHFAAESHVDNSIKNGKPFIKTNIEGTFNLLEISRQNKNLKKFIHISTDEVYGDLDELNKDSSIESDVLFPSSYYSSSKASSDLLVISANKTYKLPYLITRTCNNFGFHQNEEKFLPKIKKHILNSTTIPIYGNGQQIREWIFVDDNVSIILKLMFSNFYGIFNIGSNDLWKNIDIINYLGKKLNKKITFEFVEDRLGHDKRYSLNTDKIKSLFPNEKFKKLSSFLDHIVDT
jgi:dTDP-glucose 4,6-dehydratase